MSNDTYTEDLGRFCFREIKMLAEILNAWAKSGLPDDFSDDNVRPALNMNSGYVFLVNEDCGCAMMNDDKLESFYSTPHNGAEGFFGDLVSEFETMHPEDQAYMREIAAVLGREDELPAEDSEDAPA